VQNHGHIAELADIFASSSNQRDGEGLIGGRLSISLNGSNDAVLSGKISALTAPMSGCRRSLRLIPRRHGLPVAHRAAVEAVLLIEKGGRKPEGRQSWEPLPGHPAAVLNRRTKIVTCSAPSTNSRSRATHSHAVSFFGPDWVRCRRLGWFGVRFCTNAKGGRKGVHNALLHHTSIQNRCEGHRLVCGQELPLVH